MIATLKDADWPVRQATARALGKSGDAAAVPALIEALKDEKSDVHLAAAKALHAISEREGVRIFPDGKVERIE